MHDSTSKGIEHASRNLDAISQRSWYALLVEDARQPRDKKTQVMEIAHNPEEIEQPC